MDAKRFIKQIKRVEIRRAIEDVREYLKQRNDAKVQASEHGYATLVAYDYALVAETNAAYEKVKRLFRARNIFVVGI